MRRIAAVAVGALRNKLASVEHIGVGAVATVLTLAQVIAIFHEITPRTEVRVLAEGEEEIIFAVLVIQLEGGRLRHRVLELLELLEEWLGEIEISAVVHRVPTIRPPAIRAVHRVRALGSEGGNGRFLAETAGMPVNAMFIAKRVPPLQPAVRTQCRRRNAVLLPVKDR